MVSTALKLSLKGHDLYIVIKEEMALSFTGDRKQQVNKISI